MTRTPTPGPPLRVLFTESPAAANWEPWGREMFEQLSRESIPVLVDRDRPLADQVADPSIDAVVDMSFLASPELARGRRRPRPAVADRIGRLRQGGRRVTCTSPDPHLEPAGLHELALARRTGAPARDDGRAERLGMGPDDRRRSAGAPDRPPAGGADARHHRSGRKRPSARAAGGPVRDAGHRHHAPWTGFWISSGGQALPGRAVSTVSTRRCRRPTSCRCTSRTAVTRGISSTPAGSP